MTPHAKIMLAMLEDAARENPRAGWVNIRVLIDAGVVGVVDCVRTLLDNGVKIRTDYDRATRQVRYRMVPETRDEVGPDAPKRQDGSARAAMIRGQCAAVWELMQDGEWRDAESVACRCRCTPDQARRAIRRGGTWKTTHRLERRNKNPGQPGLEYRFTKAVV